MHKLASLTIILMFSFISTLFVHKAVVAGNVDKRIKHVDAILSGNMEPPYQYRVLLPLTGRIIEKLVRPLNGEMKLRHVVSYSIITFVTFFTVFLVFYKYLRHFYPQNYSMSGIILLQTVIPLSVTGVYMEGDFINLAFYVIGLYLIVKNKEIYLPFIIVPATLNREQSIFLVVFYLIYILSTKKREGNLLILLSCFLAWGLTILGTHLFFGFKTNNYTPALHIAHNTDPKTLINIIIPLWAAEIFPAIVLCVMAYKRSGPYFRLSFLSLIPYTLLFFLNGNMWELAKFLPAYLILIPMSLQILSGQFIQQTSTL